MHLTPLAKNRHDMIHSIYHNTDWVTYDFSKYDYKNQHKIVELKFTIDDYIETGNMILGLANKWLRLLVHLETAKP